VKLRRPRRIFRSSLPRPARRLPRLALFSGLTLRPAHLGIAAGCLAILALVTAGAVFPSAPQVAPIATTPHDRVEAAASDIAVVNGSTLRLAQRVVRLLGIETPDRGQPCPSGSGGLDCGAASTAALAALVRERNVACVLHASDALGRPLAICAAGGTELNQALVAGGWARVDTASLAGTRPDDLKNAEMLARTERRGLWGGQWGGGVWTDGS
jgi:endonuclease YncB( thermonuclease family)